MYVNYFSKNKNLFAASISFPENFRKTPKSYLYKYLKYVHDCRIGRYFFNICVYEFLVKNY